MKLNEMTYKQFRQYCEEKAINGNWGLIEAITCLEVIRIIETTKPKGLFRRRKSQKQKEKDWRRIIGKLDSGEFEYVNKRG